MGNRVACRLKTFMELMSHCESNPRLYEDKIDLPKKPDPPITNKLDIAIQSVWKRENNF